MTRQHSEKSIVVLSAASGAGHMRAADALVSALDRKGIPSLHIEVLKYTNAIFRKAYSDLYIELVNKQPEILGWIYNSLDQPWRYQKRRLALNRLNTGSFIKLLKKEKPSIALCTHFLPAEIILYLKRKKYLDVPVGVVVTDFDAHAMWFYRNVEWYFVACEETKVYLSEIGIPPETIYVTGIPIDPVFAEKKPKKALREQFGLHTDRTTILISAGGFGVGPVESLVQVIQKIKHPVQAIVSCGRNDTLVKRLSKLPVEKHPMKLLGFTSEMDKWMAASDFLVGKPGGLTSSEALASGLIMIIVNPIPGQEERNSDHFLEEGVALRCNNLPALAYKIDALLDDREKIRRMKQSVERLSRPHAASEIVSVILDAVPVA